MSSWYYYTGAAHIQEVALEYMRRATIDVPGLPNCLFETTVHDLAHRDQNLSHELVGFEIRIVNVSSHREN